MKVSVVQVDARLAGPQNRFSLLEAKVRQAAIEGVDLIVFPELFLSGYNVGEDLHLHAEAQNGPFAQRVAARAKDLNIAIAYGYPERDDETVYNAFICIDDQGRTLANHRKTILPPGSEHDWFATGSDVSVFHFAGGTIAMLICYECEFPEIMRHVALQGADIVLMATAGGADWEQVPTSVIPSRAYENGVFIAYANYCGVENGHGFCGLSCIVDPYGADLARAGRTECVVSTNLDLGVVVQARGKIPFLRDQRRVVSRLAPITRT
jgi:predicted amidohydrolase